MEDRWQEVYTNSEEYKEGTKSSMAKGKRVEAISSTLSGTLDYDSEAKKGVYHVQNGRRNSRIDDCAGVLVKRFDCVRKKRALVFPELALLPLFIHRNPIQRIGMIRRMEECDWRVRSSDAVNHR